MAKIKISDTAYKAIDEGLDNDGVLEAILEAHPGAKTKEASILWYRNEVRKRDGVPSKRQRTTLGRGKKYVKGEIIHGKVMEMYKTLDLNMSGPVKYGDGTKNIQFITQNGFH